MNINELQAMGAYGALNSDPAAGGARAMGERFAAIFDEAEQAVQGFSTQAIDAQGLVEALSQAEMALQTAVTVRDRVVAAYQEILRMPL